MVTEDAAPLDESIFSLTPKQLEFLQSKITADDGELRKRVIDTQKQAYEHFPYPCIRHFAFLKLAMAMHPAYREIIASGRRGDTLLVDIGCCMGTDVRKAAYDGYPAENIIGCDLHAEFLHLGHQLYDDASNCKISFFAADIFDVQSSETSPADSPEGARPAYATPKKLMSGERKSGSGVFSNLRELRGKVTHIYAGLLFHLFDEDAQTHLAECLAMLLCRQPGAIIFGRHEGREQSGTISAEDQRTRFGHSPETWENLWRQVFTKLENEEFTMERVRIQSRLHTSSTPTPDFANAKWLYWTVTIL